MCVVVSILCDGVFIIKKPGKSLSIIIECTTLHIHAGELLTVVVIKNDRWWAKARQQISRIFLWGTYTIVVKLIIKRCSLVYITTNVASSNPVHYDTTLCDKACQWLATGRWFIRVLWFPQPIKLTATI